MHNADVRDLEIFMRLLAEPFHFSQRHFRISFINQVKSLPVAGPFPRVAVEGHRCAALRVNQTTRDRADVDRLGG